MQHGFDSRSSLERYTAQSPAAVTNQFPIEAKSVSQMPRKSKVSNLWAEPTNWPNLVICMSSRMKESSKQSKETKTNFMAFHYPLQKQVLP
jgi:hypothetical protein